MQDLLIKGGRVLLFEDNDVVIEEKDILIKDGKIVQIKEKIDKTVNDWEKRHDKLAYYIEHDELEKVETAFVAMKSYVESEQYEESKSELDKSIFILKHIEDKYDFTLQNVF